MPQIKCQNWPCNDIVIAVIDMNYIANTTNAGHYTWSLEVWPQLSLEHRCSIVCTWMNPLFSLLLYPLVSESGEGRNDWKACGHTQAAREAEKLIV